MKNYVLKTLVICLCLVHGQFVRAERPVNGYVAAVQFFNDAMKESSYETNAEQLGKHKGISEIAELIENNQVSSDEILAAYRHVVMTLTPNYVDRDRFYHAILSLNPQDSSPSVEGLKAMADQLPRVGTEGNGQNLNVACMAGISAGGAFVTWGLRNLVSKNVLLRPDAFNAAALTMTIMGGGLIAMAAKTEICRAPRK